MIYCTSVIAEKAIREREGTLSIASLTSKRHLMLSEQPSGHMGITELEQDWLKFCRISVKERSQQCKLADNWKTGSEPQSVHDKEI